MNDSCLTSVKVRHEKLKTRSQSRRSSLPVYVDDASWSAFCFFFSPAKRAFPRDVNHSRMAAGCVTRRLANARSPAEKVSFLCVSPWHRCPMRESIMNNWVVACTRTSGCLFVWACYLIFCAPTSAATGLMEMGVNAEKTAGWLMFLCCTGTGSNACMILTGRNCWWVPVVHALIQQVWCALSCVFKAYSGPRSVSIKLKITLLCKWFGPGPTQKWYVFWQHTLIHARLLCDTPNLEYTVHLY